MPEKGRSGRLSEIAARLGITPDALAAMTDREKAKLFQQATAGTGKANRQEGPGRPDGEPTRGKHGIGKRRHQRGNRRT